MILNISSKLNTIQISRKTKHYLKKIYTSISINPHKNEWGRCICCGKFTVFEYIKYYDINSKVARSCKWDEIFTEVINVTNTLGCYWCNARFRIRCPAESLLNFFGKGKILSIKELHKHLREGRLDITVLETGSTGGIFSDYESTNNIIKSEYYDEIERGKYKEGVRSEDLQNLTFDSNTIDAVISLDVFEHIPDPWKAFSEINRVLKPGGVGIITVPLDIRNETTMPLAKIENGEIKYFTEPSYHLDPLREDGALVFTEFGTDIISKLRDMGYNASFDTYKSKKTNIIQLVILMQKSC